jgi:hypothetical protein
MADAVQLSSDGRGSNGRKAAVGAVAAVIVFGICAFLLRPPVRAHVQPVAEHAFSTQGFHRVEPAETHHARWLGVNIVRYRLAAKRVYAGDSGENDAMLYARSWLAPGFLHHNTRIAGMCGTTSSGCWRPPGGPVSHQFPGRPQNLIVWVNHSGDARVRLLPWSPHDYSRPYGYAISFGWRWDGWLVAWIAAIAAVVTGLARAGSALHGTRPRRDNTC